MSKVIFNNENCFDTMKRMYDNGEKVDIVLTSPPYNTSRLSQTKKSFENYTNRYDIHLDNMTDDEYCDWSVNLFGLFDKILEKDGVILYNISYASENPNVLWLFIGDLMRKTNFMIADCIIWKKNSALPNNVSPNKLTRITEFVFVICRKDEFKTFRANKKITSQSPKGQNFYEGISNFIVAPNNDGHCELNTATYSSELCLQLLNIYCRDSFTVYDPFMGSGTTAVACEKFMEGKNNLLCIGSELSSAQVEYSKNRLNNFKKDFCRKVEQTEFTLW